MTDRPYREDRLSQLVLCSAAESSGWSHDLIDEPRERSASQVSGLSHREAGWELAGKGGISRNKNPSLLQCTGRP